MINLYQTLQWMYGGTLNATIARTIFDGTSEVISFWDASLGPQPTQAQIDAARTLAEPALKMASIRAERDRRLAATDYMAMPDYPTPPVGLAAYRQALRDFPATADINNPVWPVL